jgi:hypothetical protein
LLSVSLFPDCECKVNAFLSACQVFSAKIFQKFETFYITTWLSILTRFNIFFNIFALSVIYPHDTTNFLSNKIASSLFFLGESSNFLHHICKFFINFAS